MKVAATLAGTANAFMPKEQASGTRAEDPAGTRGLRSCQWKVPPLKLNV